MSNAVYAAADALREAILELLPLGDRRRIVLAALDALVMDVYPDLYVTVDSVSLARANGAETLSGPHHSREVP